MTPAQIRTFNQLARGTVLTTAELMHGIPSAKALTAIWLFKWYVTIIVCCGSSVFTFILLMTLFGEI